MLVKHTIALSPHISFLFSLSLFDDHTKSPGVHSTAQDKDVNQIFIGIVTGYMNNQLGPKKNGISMKWDMYGTRLNIRIGQQ